MRRTVTAVLLAAAPVVAAAEQNPSAESLAHQLSAVRALYANASYEEALANLDVIPVGESTELVDQFRALCHLALNRIPETERALERIVRSSPMYRMTDADVSPRLVAMYVDVRRRVLPIAAKETYARGRWNYQGGDYDAAADDLRQLLAILADPDMANASRDILDLKLVAEGFLKLAEAELGSRPGRTAAPATSARISPAPFTPQAPSPNGSAPARIYNGDDDDVKAPIELSRRMPLWSPPAAYTGGEFRGALELVVDEAGNVISAVSRGQIMPSYDEALRAAARHWKYRPAMLRDGTPVRYRLLVGYLLKPVGF